MSWQQSIHEHLLSDPNRWFTIGELYDKFSSGMADNLAMRFATRLYEPEFMPNPEKAEWLYFLHTLRQIGVERQGAQRHWGYKDSVRIARVSGRSCEICGSPVIKKTWTTRSFFLCLVCDFTSAHSPTPSPSLTSQSALTSSSTPTPTLPPTPTPPLTSSPPPTPSSSPAPTSSPAQTLEVVEVRPEQRKAALAAGYMPVRQTEPGTWLVRMRQHQPPALFYRNRLWPLRKLAQYLKTLLPFFTVNRIEEELQRCGYKVEMLLQKHGRTDRIVANRRDHLTINSVGNQLVESYGEFLKALRTQSK